jgi:hypothetical protein
MDWRLPGGMPLRVPLRVPLRLRVLFRGVFALLALALVALALSVLQDEKQRSHRVYADAVNKNLAQIAARLRHPTGQLALLNPAAADRPAQPVRPLVLPFAALDFDDRHKALQAVEMAGCALQYADGASLCVAVGSNPYAGGLSTWWPRWPLATWCRARQPTCSCRTCTVPWSMSTTAARPAAGWHRTRSAATAAAA